MPNRIKHWPFSETKCFKTNLADTFNGSVMGKRRKLLCTAKKKKKKKYKKKNNKIKIKKLSQPWRTDSPMDRQKLAWHYAFSSWEHGN